MCSTISSIVLPPLRAGSLICSQIWPSDLPSQAISIGARCQSGWPGMLFSVSAWPTTATFSAPWQVLHIMPGMPISAVAARDRRLVRMHVHALQRAVGRRVAVDAARMLDDLAGLLEQRDRPRRLVGDAFEGARRLELDRRRLRFPAPATAADESEEAQRARRRETLRTASSWLQPPSCDTCRHDGQAAHRLAGQPAPGIGDGGPDGRRARLADAGRLLAWTR